VSVAIVDLGCANIASVVFALDRLGTASVVTSDAGVIGAADKIILPGVGAAAFALARMDALGLRSVLREATQPLLGICLGMQLLFERSEEGDVECLGLLPGIVKKLSQENDLTWPHMGWSRLSLQGRGGALVSNVEDGAYAYFVHGFAMAPSGAAVALAHHGAPFSAAVEAGDVYGCQFHPERSGAVGAQILSNFLAV